MYQGHKNGGQRLQGKVRSSKIEDDPLRIRRKWGKRIRSDRRVVLHQKIEMGYLMAVKMFSSLVNASKSNKTVMGCDVMKATWELKKQSSTVWKRQLPDHQIILAPAEQEFPSRDSSLDSGCKVGTTVPIPLRVGGDTQFVLISKESEQNGFVLLSSQGSEEASVLLHSLIPSQWSDAMKTWSWQPWMEDGGAQDQRNWDSPEWLPSIATHQSGTRVFNCTWVKNKLF